LEAGTRTRFLSCLRERPYFAVALAFVFLDLVFFIRSLPGDFVLRDVFHEFLTIKVLWGHAREGHFALWNPHTMLGAPLAGAVYPGAFYPLNFILFWWPGLQLDLGIKVYVLFHYAAAGFFMFFMLRQIDLRDSAAFTGAVCYAFSGYLVSQHYALNLLAGMAFVPAAAGMAMRGRSGGRLWWYLWGGLAAGLVFLGGDPQGFIIALLLSLLGALFLGGVNVGESPLCALRRRNTAAGVLIFLLAAFGLAAAELLPAIQVLKESARGGGMEWDVVSCWSFHPLRTLELFFARPFGDPWPLNHWWGAFMGEKCFPLPLCISPYAGAWTLIACVLALRGFRASFRPVLFFTLLVVVSLFLAFGRFNPLMKFIYSFVPGMNLFRYPEKYLLLTALGLSSLAAVGTDRVPYTQGSPRKEGRIGGALLYPALAMVAVVVLWMSARMELPLIASALEPLLEGTPEGVTPGQAARGLVSSVTRTALFLCVGVIVLQTLRRTAGRWIALAPAVFLFLDLWQANAALAPSAPGLFRMKSRLAEKILQREGLLPCQEAEEEGEIRLPCCRGDFETCASKFSYRLYRERYIPSPRLQTYEEFRRWERNTLKPNLAMMEGFEYFCGFNVAGPARLERMMGETVFLEHLPVFNVKYAIVRAELEPGEALAAEEVAEYRGARVWELEGVFPRAYWIEEARRVEGAYELSALFKTHDFTESVLIEAEELSGGRGDAFYQGPAVAGARVSYHGPNRAVVEVDAPADGWLVLNDSYYPGWKAEVNGEESRIYRANGLVRAVRVEKGWSRVVFEYSPRGLFAGILASCLAAAAGLLGLALKR